MMCQYDFSMVVHMLCFETLTTKSLRHKARVAVTLVTCGALELRLEQGLGVRSWARKIPLGALGQTEGHDDTWAAVFGPALTERGTARLEKGAERGQAAGGACLVVRCLCHHTQASQTGVKRMQYSVLKAMPVSALRHSVCLDSASVASLTDTTHS